MWAGCNHPSISHLSIQHSFVEGSPTFGDQAVKYNTTWEDSRHPPTPRICIQKQPKIIQHPSFFKYIYGGNQPIIMRTYSWVSKLWHHSRVRKSLYSLVVFWVDSSLYHFGIWAILSRYKDSCMVYRPEWYWNKYVVKNWYLTCIKMIWIPHYRYLDDIEKYDANPTL
jgi:hypothetical protein